MSKEGGQGSSGKRSSLGEHGKYSNIVSQIERTILNVVVSVENVLLRRHLAVIRSAVLVLR